MNVPFLHIDRFILSLSLVSCHLVDVSEFEGRPVVRKRPLGAAVSSVIGPLFLPFAFRSIRDRSFFVVLLPMSTSADVFVHPGPVGSCVAKGNDLYVKDAMPTTTLAGVKAAA